MNDGQSIPSNSVYDLPSFDILSDGQEIDPGYQVHAVIVEHTANKVPVARIILRDGEASEGKFQISDDGAFDPGKEIQIKAGTDGNNEAVFKGLVVKHKIKAPESGNSMLYIECRDEAFTLTLGRKNKYFQDAKDSDAIKEVLASLAGTIDATTVTHERIIQHYITDWDFVVSRAEANGLLVLANQGKVDVKKPKVEGSKLKLAFGGNLLEFEAEIDARYQWKEVKTEAWDYATQSVIDATSKAKFPEFGDIKGDKLSEVGKLKTYELRHSGNITDAELKAWADATMLKSRLAKTRGRAKFIGFFALKPGETVELVDVSNHFNGQVYITGVRYELIGGSCYTDVQFGLSPKWFYQENDVIDAQASGLLPGINGLQIGTVLALEGDPEGEDRIHVSLPVADPEGTGIWARIATLDAGANRGWNVRPEIGDEVIVGFVNDDLRMPVVLGQLHSSINPAPIPGADDNHIKGYTSRSEMHLQFDDEKKIITIDTPAGNSIVISEEDTAITVVDQNGNEYKMDPAGISMKSIADINIEAAAAINIKAGAAMKIEAASMEMSAQTSLKLAGSASAELSSGGTTTIKGSVVMIN